MMLNLYAQEEILTFINVNRVKVASQKSAKQAENSILTFNLKKAETTCI
jgi:hypothetical protein